MRINLIADGLDLIPFLAEGGIVQIDVERQNVQVTTLDGKLWKRSKRVRGFELSCRTMRDSFFQKISAALAPDQVSLTYTDRDTGTDRTALFYVGERTAGVKQIRGGNTYWQGVRYYLEEM